MDKLRLIQNDSVYHIFNRGVEKRPIFMDKNDYFHFLVSLAFYQQTERETRFSFSDFKISDRSNKLRFDLLAYCLMPNHFHLLIRQNSDNGIVSALAQLLNSYTKYFNTKYKRIGHLFQGKFKSVSVLSDEQLIHVARYIFLNPYSSKLVDNPLDYTWSAFPEYCGKSSIHVCEKKDVLAHFSEIKTFKKFILDYADYARSLHDLQNELQD